MPHHDQHNVLIVAAGKWAYHCFHRYAAYICQPDRSFRSNATRLGYYGHGEIKPEFPRIFPRRSRVSITQESVESMRSTGKWQDAAFACVVERLCADGHRATESQIFLLSGPEEPQTLNIAHPIQHVTSGRGTAWTQSQRYVPQAAILAAPTTTIDLADLMAEDRVEQD